MFDKLTDKLTFLKSEISEKLKQKSPTFVELYAPPLGLEPRTCGLTVRRSNQLS